MAHFTKRSIASVKVKVTEVKWRCPWKGCFFLNVSEKNYVPYGGDQILVCSNCKRGCHVNIPITIPGPRRRLPRCNQ